jgi:hypothetical protein
VLEVRSDQPRRAQEALRHQSVVRESALYGDRLHLLVEPPAARALPVVVAALAASGLVAPVEPVPPSLEDVFIALVTAGERATVTRTEGGG